jgi:hypothetical protein
MLGEVTLTPAASPPLVSTNFQSLSNDTQNLTKWLSPPENHIDTSLLLTDHDGIRLIVLHPSRDKAATVQCKIIHTAPRLAQDIYDPYTALSYVWGDSNNRTTISVDGHPLQVTRSLECALRHLRDERGTLDVWADGVCINQKDDAEKGKQV